MNDNSQLSLFGVDADLHATDTRTVIDLYSYSHAMFADAYAGSEGGIGERIRAAMACIHQAIECASPGVEIMVSSSWGKDSTAMVSLIVDVLAERKEAGLRILPCHIVTADTGNEFVDMQVRVAEQNSRLSAWAEKRDLPIKTYVVGPDAEDTLYALLVGAGYALPSYTKSKSANPQNWCVDRLKIGPIGKALKLAKTGHGGVERKLLHFVGVRLSESSKRKATIEEYAQGMPWGLSRIGEKGETDGSRIAVQPIACWDHETLRTYLKINMAAWDAFSFESLKVIYRKAADSGETESLGECSISRTADGGVSNTCSDLSGARLGCLTCIRSSNRSLSNYAKNDPAYRWIKVVHSFIYRGMADHRRRLLDLEAHGFDNQTFCARSHSFKWRYTLLMLIYRAEIESGFTLITPEVEKAIEAHWSRSGISFVSTADAKRDAFAWKSSRKFVRSYVSLALDFERLTVALPDGVPAGVYAHLRHPDYFKRAMSLPNLLPFVGRGTYFFPSPKAYVFRDHHRGGFFTLVTDVVSDAGKKLNTAGLNGYQGIALELIGVRDLTAWESQLARGRNFFYRHVRGQFEATFERITGEKWVPYLPENLPSEDGGMKRRLALDVLEIANANMNLADIGGDEFIADAYIDNLSLLGLQGRVSRQSISRLIEVVAPLVSLSDYLSEQHESRTRAIRRQLERTGTIALLGSKAHGGETSEEALTAVQQSVAQECKDGWDMDDFLATYEKYLSGMKDLKGLFEEGLANAGLVNKLAYAVRTAIYDEEYAAGLMGEILTGVGLIRHPSEANAHPMAA